MENMKTFNLKTELLGASGDLIERLYSGQLLLLPELTPMHLHFQKSEQNHGHKAKRSTAAGRASEISSECLAQ